MNMAAALIAATLSVVLGIQVVSTGIIPLFTDKDGRNDSWISIRRKIHSAAPP